MIRTLQKKFTVTAMIAVTVLLAVLLGAINAVNAFTQTAESGRLLEALAMQEGFGPAPTRPDDDFQDGRRGFFQQPMNENRRMSALYFTVRYGSGGEAEDVELRHIASVDEDEARALAARALASGKDSGRLDSYRFQIVEPAEGTKTVILLDVSTQRYNVLRVAALSALAGGLAWGAMLVLVMALSRRAIRPIAENMERQRQFVTDAGHEFKTPLAIIQANLDAMELMGGESKYSRNIRSQTRRLSDLMQNLLTLARIDENSVPMDLSEVDLSALAAEELEMFRAPAELKGIAVDSELAPGVAVQASRAQIAQLLSTLLDNAVKYCPEGGRVAMRLQRGDRAVLTLANTVSAPVDTARIFDRFYRADAARSQKAGGFGIGLSAAEAIVRLYKGSISARMDGEDTVVFTVKL